MVCLWLVVVLQVYTEVEISFYLLRRLLGVKAQDGGKQAKVQKLVAKEVLMVNIGSTATGGKVRTGQRRAGQAEAGTRILMEGRRRRSVPEQALTATAGVCACAGAVAGPGPGDEGGLRQDPAHGASLHAGEGEDRAQQARGQALAPHRVGPDPQRHHHRHPGEQLRGGGRGQQQEGDDAQRVCRVAATAERFWLRWWEVV